MAEPATESRPRHSEHAGRVDDDLTGLLARLGDDAVTLIDSKLGLLKLDVEAEVRRYARGALAHAAWAAVGVIGVALVATGLAFALAWSLPSSLDPLLARALAFGGIGLVVVISAGLVLGRGTTSGTDA